MFTIFKLLLFFIASALIPVIESSNDTEIDYDYYYPYNPKETHFHCLRYGQSCLNGGICQDENGICLCDFPFEDPIEFAGYRCEQNVTGLQTIRWNCPCSSHAFQCYQPAVGIPMKCLCLTGWFGDDCNQDRVNLECNGDGMKVFFNPIQPFNGSVYFENDVGEEPCYIYPDDDEDEYPFSKQIGHDEGCGLKIKSPLDEYNNGTVYTRQLIIQYDPLFQSDLDLPISVSCYHMDNGQWVTVEGSLGVERGNMSRGLDIESTFFPVKMAFQYTSTNEQIMSGSTVYIGQRLNLVNYLTSTSVYDRVGVESCTFSNSDGDKRLVAISNGCATDRSLALDVGFPETADIDLGVGVSYIFRAFRFGFDPIVQVSCVVRVCRRNENTTGCDLPDCHDDRRGKRDVDMDVVMHEKTEQRTKRDASENRQNEGVTSQSFTVIDPYEGDERALEVTVDECLDKPVIKTVGASLMAAFAVVVLLCIALALCMCRMKFANRDMALKLRYRSDNAGKTISGITNVGFDSIGDCPRKSE